jgi:hypothetical protein
MAASWNSSDGEMLMFAKRIAWTVVVVGFAFHWSSLSGFAGTIVSIDPLSQAVQVGQSFSVDILVTDVPVDAGLMAWSFDLEFDPSILSALSVTQGPFLLSVSGNTTDFFAGNIFNATGDIIFVNEAVQSGGAAVSGSGVLATINFQALAAGTSPINLRNVILEGEEGGLDDVSAVDGSVDVNGVPEPSTLVIWSLVAGIFGIGGLGKRLKRSTAA